MKSSSTDTGIATTGVVQRLDPRPEEWFLCKITVVGTSGGRNIYTVVEVDPDTTGFGYVTKSGGITVAGVWEFNDNLLTVGTICFARFRSWNTTGETYELHSASGGSGLGAGCAAKITAGQVPASGSALAYFPATADTAPAGGPWVTGAVCRVINVGNNGPLSIGKRYPAVYVGVIGGVNVYVTKGGKTEFVSAITCAAGTITTVTQYGDFDLWVGGGFSSGFSSGFSTES